MGVENRGLQLQAVCCALVASAFVSTLLRCYVRVRIVRNFGFDDSCMLVALVSFILFVTCALLGVHYGTGRHYWDLDIRDREEAMKYWWFCYLWYCVTMIASKISIGYFLLRITIRRVDIWIIYSVMILTVVTGIAFFFVTLFQCSPISYFWRKDQDGTCIDMEVIIALTYLYSACSVVCDFTFAILPLTIIWRLKMDRRSKIALIPIMIMACVASTAVVVRFAFVQDFDNPDFLYATVDIAIWSTTEQGLAITAGSLATLRPLFRIIGQSLRLSSRRPSMMQHSDQRIGEGISHSLSKSPSSGRRQGEPFTLTTVDEQSNKEGDEVECAGHQQPCPEALTKNRSSTNSLWKLQEQVKSESEEELKSGC